jgi:formate dehydrogenase iron-sulfur subunit
MTMQSLSVERRSATTTASPSVRGAAEPVAKLIDISKCIGCKACQVACMQWNDLRDEVGVQHGIYDNPVDLTDQSWTVMRFAEYQSPEGKLEWLIRKDGCMHCEDPGCLKACPAPGAIVKYANGIVDFNSSNCIGCGYCIAGCPFNIPRISEKDNKAYKCTLCSDRVAVGLEPACVKTCPTGAIQFGAKTDMVARGAKRVGDLKERGHAQAALYDPAGRRRYPRHVRAAAWRQAGALQRPAQRSEDQSVGQLVERGHQAAAVDRSRPGGPWRVLPLRHAWSEGRRTGHSLGSNRHEHRHEKR